MNRDKQMKKDREQIKLFDNAMIHDANEDLNGDYENQGDFYENYEQEALKKNVYIF
jgi:hypothetical protein